MNTQDYLPRGERFALMRLTHAMADKLYAKYLEGYSGFEGATDAHLSRLLHKHVAKGDPVDVANFCAFLNYNAQRIVADPLPRLARDVVLFYDKHQQDLIEGAEGVGTGSALHHAIEGLRYALKEIDT